MPLEMQAAVIRSGLSPANTWRRPLPSSPISASGPTRTSSKNTVNWCSGCCSAAGIVCQVSPSVSVGTTNSDSGWRPFGPASGARVTTRTASASSMPEVQYFWPRSRQPSPSGWAVVVISWLLDPASGSVMAKAIFSEPSAMPGSQRDLSSCEPCVSMMVPQIAGR